MPIILRTMTLTMTLLSTLLFVFGCVHDNDNVLPVYSKRQGMPEWRTATQLKNENARPLPDFQLTDQLGNRIDKTIFRQHVTVANFFFSQCRNQCPQLTAGMKRIQQAFQQSEQLLLLSHSVAVGIDNATSLRQFADINGINSQQWRLLSGDGATLDRMASEIYLLPDIIEDRDRLVHSELFVLLDDKQRVRGFYNGSLALEIDNLINDIQRLQSE